MHPLIRFVCFLVVVFFISFREFPSLLLSIPGIAIAWLISRRFPTRKLMRLLWRLRWFYLSIFLLYGYFTPGEFAFGGDSKWMPSIDGLSVAFIKVSLLIAIVLWADVWFGGLSRERWLQGMHGFLRPFTWLGVNRDRFVLRLLLTMDELLKLQAQTDVSPGADSATFKQRIQRTALAVKARFLHAANDRTVPAVIEFESAASPRWYEWLWPILLAVVYYISLRFIHSSSF